MLEGPFYDLTTDPPQMLDIPQLTRHRGTMFMSCPRHCPVDVREHHSSDLLRFDQCDTDAGRRAAELEQIRVWMLRHDLSLTGGVLTAERIIAARDADWDDALTVVSGECVCPTFKPFGDGHCEECGGTPRLRSATWDA